MSRDVVRHQPGQTGLARPMVWLQAPPPPRRPPSLGMFWWRRGWLILLLVAAAAAGVELYLRQVTPIYASTARLIIQQVSKTPAQDQTFLYRQGELIKSTQVVDPLTQAEAGPLRALAGDQAPLEFIWDQLHVDVGEQEGVLSLRLDSPDPPLATALLEEVIAAFTAYHTGQQQGGNEAAIANLHAEMAEAEKTLQEIDQQVLDFKRDNQAVALRGDIDDFLVNQLTDKTRALNEAQRQLDQAQARHDAARTAFATPQGVEQYVKLRQGGEQQALMDRSFAKMQTELDQLRQSLEDPSNRRNANHPATIDARARMTYLQQKRDAMLKEFAQAQMALLVHNLDVARRQQAQAAQAQATLKTQAVEMTAKAGQYNELITRRRRVDKQRDALAEQLGAITLAARAPAVEINVTEPPHASSEPIWPQAGPIRIGALSAALLLGLLSALALDATLLHRRAQAAADTDLRVLGVLPHIPDLGATAAAGAAGASASPAVSGSAGRARIVQLDPGSESVSTYQALSSEILAVLPGGSPRTLLVTSPTQGDGKTTVASNLAITLTRAGYRVLLIDADLTNPTLAATYALGSADPGLPAVLVDPATLDRALRATDVIDLEVLPTQPYSASLPDILDGNRVSQLFRALSKRYDLVLLDGPAALASPHVGRLASVCDATVLVLRAQSSNRRMAEQAWASILDAGGHLVGVVANDVAPAPPTAPQLDIRHATPPAPISHA